MKPVLVPADMMRQRQGSNDPATGAFGSRSGRQNSNCRASRGRKYLGRAVAPCPSASQLWPRPGESGYRCGSTIDSITYHFCPAARRGRKILPVDVGTELFRSSLNHKNVRIVIRFLRWRPLWAISQHERKRQSCTYENRLFRTSHL